MPFLLALEQKVIEYAWKIIWARCRLWTVLWSLPGDSTYNYKEEGGRYDRPSAEPLIVSKELWRGDVGKRITSLNNHSVSLS